jgi:hypothetical protein
MDFEGGQATWVPIRIGPRAAWPRIQETIRANLVQFWAGTIAIKPVWSAGFPLSASI